MDTINQMAYADSLAALALKKEDPAEIRRLYLEAAEICIKTARDAESEERKACLQRANDYYLKSQTNQFNFNSAKKLSIKKPNRRFSDIAGLEKIKEEIRMKIIEPLKHPDVFKYFGKKAGGGILMYGPPGCGKSLIAEATAGEAEVAFYNAKASDLKSKYVGETEQNIAKLFEDARKEKAAIIFFDEFEALGCDRYRMSSNMKGAVSQLLSEMDGVGNKDQNILVIAATNEPWNIDNALLREGRFGTTIYIPPPDNISRLEMFMLHMRSRPVDEIAWHDLAEATENFSGADVKSLCEMATDVPLKEYFKTRTKRNITNEDFYEALLKTKPSLGKWYRQAYAILSKRNEISSFPEIAEDARKFAMNPMRISS